MRLYEWQSKQVALSDSFLQEFQAYLNEVWGERRQYEDKDLYAVEDEVEEESEEQRFFDFTMNKQIRARNYVGVVQFDGLRIEVCPKILEGRHDLYQDSWHLNLLYWLSYCHRMNFPFSMADLKLLDFDNFLESLVYVFARHTVDCISIQPYQAYERVEEELPHIRGALHMEGYVSGYLSTGNWQKLYCTHDTHTYDNNFNRIIKYVSRKLLGLVQSPVNEKLLGEILFILNDVSEVRCTAMDCDRVKLNPLFADHKTTLGMCRMFLANQVVDTKSDDNRNFCFLIPMEYVFEDFVYGFVKAHWPHLNVLAQHNDFLAFRGGERAFQIRNDILIGNELVMDTKYKIRQRDGSANEGVKHADMYQMLAYAVTRSCAEVLLLYPFSKVGLSRSTEFEIKPGMLGQRVRVMVSNLDIAFSRLEDAEEQIRQRISQIHGVFSEH